MQLATVATSAGLLVASNVFMTFAWYAHLRDLRAQPLWVAILVSWGIAFFEYMLQAATGRSPQKGQDPRPEVQKIKPKSFKTETSSSDFEISPYDFTVVDTVIDTDSPADSDTDSEPIYKANCTRHGTAINSQ